MKSKFFFFLKYFIFWVIIFTFFKLIFIIYHLEKFNDTRLIDYILIFINGFKLDFSLIGYFFLIPTLLLVVLSLFKNNLLKPIINIYTLVLLFFVSFLEIIDMELYNYWGFRLDETFLDYINTPKEMLANLLWYHFIILLATLGILYFFMYKLLYLNLFINDQLKNSKHDWKSSLIFFVILPVLIIPIRGGLSTSTINTGSVYFHNDIIVNHAAINPIWNLLYTVTESEKLKFQVTFFDEEKETELIKDLYSTVSKPVNVLKSDTPNIVLIILESFSASIIEDIGGKEGISPNFSKLIHEGIFFNNFYSSGSSSATGIGAIISDFPAMPKTCILYYENKSEKLPGISKDLKSRGYSTKFFYGGDIDFAHIKSYLINSQFDEIISHLDFPAADYFSKWGVPDHIVFNRLLEETNKTKEPFFHAFFTLSSHEPFDVPMETVIDRKYFNSVYYTDKSLGEYINNAKKQPWWDNTLVILVADHGARFDDITYFDKRRFHIPMLWIGGALSLKDTVITKFGTHTDIAATLLNQLSIETHDYVYSKDLLDYNSKSFAYYTCQNGIGFLTDTSYLLYDLNTDNFLQEEGKVTDITKETIKAYLQAVLKDFNNR